MDKTLRAVLLGALLVTLTGCALLGASQEPADGAWSADRIQAYLAHTPDLEDALVAALQGRTLVAGMSELQALMVAGYPDQIRQALDGLLWVYHQTSAAGTDEPVRVVVKFRAGEAVQVTVVRTP